MPEIETIAAVARVILRLCEEDVDVRTKLQRIAYAAAVIKRHADVELEQLNPAMEVCNG